MLDALRKLRHYDIQTLEITVTVMLSKIKKYDIQTWALIAGIAICLAFAGYWIVTAIKWIPYVNQMDYGEGYNMYVAKLWANGQWNWDITQEPYLTIIYGPIFYIIMTPLIDIFGLGFDIARTTMAIATVLSSIFSGLIVYQISKNKLLAVFAGLLPMIHPIIRDWGIQARVDPLAVLFSIVGIWWVIRFRTSKWFWLAPLFFAASFYTKVSIMGATTVIIFLALNRDWKRMLGFGSICAVLIFTPMIAFRPLFDHMLLYNNQPMWKYIGAIISPALMFIMPMIGAIVIAMLYIRKKFKSLPSIWLIVTVVISSALLFRQGSSTNYYIESIYAVVIASTLSIPILIDYAKKHLNWQTAGVWIIAIIMIPTLSPSNMHVIIFPNEKYTEAVSEVQAIIADTNEPIPTENAGAVIMAGKDLVAELMIFTQMANTKKWDESTYVNDLKTHRYDYLVLVSPLTHHVNVPEGHFSAPVSKAMIENYSLIYHSDNEWWYVFNVYESNSKLENSGRTAIE